MNKIRYIWSIVKDRWANPYDNILLRFNPISEENQELVWRVIINDNINLASSFEIHGYVYDVLSDENGTTRYNVGCKGVVRWQGTKAIIITAKKEKGLF